MSDQFLGLAKMREKFPPNQISYLPKGGVQLAFVGHAALTDRLLDVDPAWTWEPLALGANGLPVLDECGGLWIKLTVCGVTRLGYGDAGQKKGGDAMKERIGDALRNAAMRFGAALELWHKGDLHADETDDIGTEADRKANARSTWLNGWIATINVAINAGAMKAALHEAVAEAQKWKDTDAEQRFIAAAEAKVAEAKAKAAKEKA